MAMASRRLELTIALLFTCLAPSAPAQDAKQDQGAATAASPATRTGKERLGPKWSDEQRIDNCKVPLDKRGAKPRPSECTNAPPS
jgi:hypothetical protein